MKKEIKKIVSEPKIDKSYEALVRIEQVEITLKKMKNTPIKDKALMKLLKVKEISYLIATTSMGELRKCLRENEDEYYYSLDSVTLDKETTKELLKLL